MINSIDFNNISLLIFDCDGVLVDTEPVISSAYKKLYKNDFGNTDMFPESIIQKGKKVGDCLRELYGAECDLNHKYHSFRETLYKEYDLGVQSIPGIENVLKKIKVPYCISSSSPRKDINIVLEQSGLKDYFPDEIIFSSYDINAWKPDPGVFLAASSHFGIDPKNCLVIEDSKIGIEAAKNACMNYLNFLPNNPQLEKFEFNDMNDLHSIL